MVQLSKERKEIQKEAKQTLLSIGKTCKMLSADALNWAYLFSYPGTKVNGHYDKV